jgi:hypothetical protein
MTLFRLLTRIPFLPQAIVIVCTALPAIAQHNVEGVVVNENGAVVAGANILIMGTPEGTAADSLGRFKLILPHGQHRLLIAYIKHKWLETNVSIKPAYHYTINTVLIRDTGKNRKLKSSCEIQGRK